MGRLNAMVSGVLMLALAMSGCGGSSSASSSPSAQSPGQTSSSGQTNTTASTTTGAQTATDSTSQQVSTPTASTAEHVPRATLQISSSAFKAGDAIPVRYTCDGANISPPLKWGAIPKGTVELVLSIVAAERQAPRGGVLAYWIVAGLHPGLKGISAGKLPAGAIVGRNSLGQTKYTICPHKGSSPEHYLVALYALHHHVPARPGIAANTLYTKVVRTAGYEGFTGFTYKRR